MEMKKKRPHTRRGILPVGAEILPTGDDLVFASRIVAGDLVATRVQRDLFVLHYESGSVVETPIANIWWAEEDDGDDEPKHTTPQGWTFQMIDEEHADQVLMNVISLNKIFTCILTIDLS